ncbi:type III secretion system gatekeeper subunit SctW [Prosthecobacter dejongeii]|uniref:Type III secretion protein W n=1 Tax=Prosthecobacter dejongeii TaxID=48465 RepID=A0A7W8DPR9_9BACT|nr:type III secretion system gatekeeper subunit SctW [Prosthecobacter dejongeii]MBB5037713.1 type III secretion protein W [Prosthecobacter dejongeii]
MSTIGSDMRALVSSFSSKEGLADSLAQAQRQEGQFKGQTVTMQMDASTALQNAAEEMTFVASEKVEKKLSERKAGSKESLKLSSTELAEKYVNMTGKSQSSEKFHEFMDAVKKRGAGVSEQELKDMLQREFSDVSEQYAAIAFTEESLKREDSPELQALAKKAANVKETLLKEAGPAIRAGINIASDVLSFSKQGLEQLEKLRDLYRFAVLGRPTVSDMYQAIMGRYGESRFTQALDFLIQAAGSDLDAHGMGPSMESAHLETAVNNINYVQQMGNLYRVLADLVDKVRPHSTATSFSFPHGQ